VQSAERRVKNSVFRSAFCTLHSALSRITMHASRTLALPAALVLLAAVAGCSDDGPKVVTVTGKLTYKGKPLPNTLINFLPERGRQSWALTDAEGRFKINYDADRDGAVVGKHKVWLDYRPNSRAEQEAEMQGKPPQQSPEMKALFAKYTHEKSPLSVQIDKNTKELNLDLD
jgi:hypothetical protein